MNRNCHQYQEHLLAKIWKKPAKLCACVSILFMASHYCSLANLSLVKLLNFLLHEDTFSRDLLAWSRHSQQPRNPLQEDHVNLNKVTVNKRLHSYCCLLSIANKISGIFCCQKSYHKHFTCEILRLLFVMKKNIWCSLMLYILASTCPLIHSISWSRMK